jgi:uncharacterized heparinase superfamily protein
MTTDAEFLKLLRLQLNNGPVESSGFDSVSVLMQHFGERAGTSWPAIPNAITDMRIDLSRMTDEEIVERANNALEGDLHPSGVRPRTRSNGRLDWVSNPATSREWLLMLHRHAWWVLWGAAYERTGDEKYAEAFVAQLDDWIDQHPVPQQKSEQLESWRLMEAGLRMRLSWIPAFACFFDSPAFADSTKLKMLRTIYDHAQFLYRFHTNRNHLVRESNGLIAVGLCFPEFAAAAKWVERGLHRLDRELQAQVNADGSHIEMSTGYQWLTIDEFEATKSLLDKYQHKLPMSDLDEALHSMYEVLAAIIRPDRTFPQLNDGFVLWDARRLAEAGRRYGWGEIECAGSGDASSLSLVYCSRSFPNAGIHVMRSDWTADARYLIADTGPYGGPHGHEDKLSFELFAFGAPFVVDPGSYTYSKSDPYRNYFVGSQGHNTVLVDQCSQIRRWDAQHMTPAVHEVSHGLWRSSNDVDFASGRYDEGYAPFSLSRPAGMSVDFDVTHQRDFVFVKPDYWIVADYLDASELHQYNFLFHLAPDVVVENLTSSTALLRSSRNGAQMFLAAHTDHEISSEVIEGSESPIQGWYSEDHYKKCAAPVLSFSVCNMRSVFVAWVLYPLAPATDAAQVRTRVLHEPGLGQHVLSVQYADKTDSVSILNDPKARSGHGGNPFSEFSIERGGKRWRVGSSDSRTRRN